ncbi:sulfur carrier protein ThiS [Facilibium subflavum]|uniref:sulfur carrier protein ThiS n=1 Tax=Facilibium subflavum TaxID=2219058 RepID=UPI000E65D239|nr:sulfur carrier protein ThiS [Facilibium subflavum]
MSTRLEIIVNGEKQQFNNNTSLQDLIDGLGVQLGYSAVALNKNIISKGKYHQHLLKEGDQVDILTPMQGG